MKNKVIKSVFVAFLLVVYSCDEPETTVTNTVHADGSVTRHIEMRNNENKFKLSDLQVPFDSTWIIKDTIEIGVKKDTTWIKTAEKLFKNTGEINKSYLSDKGANKKVSRIAGFSKKFKWFNTIYRYSESVEKQIGEGYQIDQFLNKDELNYFYSPESINNEKKNSADSLKFRALEDTIKTKTDRWTEKSFIAEWVGVFSKLTAGKGGNDVSKESLKSREGELYKILKKYDNKFDSIWATGLILKEMIGEQNAMRFKAEGDSAIAVVMRKLFPDFKEYSVRIVMPGILIGTNGFIDKTDKLLWPVKSDFFLTSNYEMWAESKQVNTWAWIVTGVFVLFVLTGLILRLFRRH